MHEQQSSDLLTAVRFKSVEEIRTILKNKPRVNFKDTYGDTVLHKAAWRRDLDILRLILTLDVDLNCRSNQGETPLHLAAKRKWEDGVKVM